jgi:zinc and cadmium transporter
MEILVALSVGLILSVVFLGFIPEVVNHSDLNGTTIGILLLSGIAIFYILDLFLHWHHCKDLWEDGHTHHDHEHHNSPLISVGTFFDNFVHGMVLFSAFSVNISFGIATTAALLLHAIPQNIANLLMNHKDTKFVYIAASGGILWALAIYPFQEFLTHYSFHILALIAGWLLYTAMSDILPSFKKKWETLHKLIYLVCMLAGVGIFLLMNSWEHEHWHDDEHLQEEIHEEYHEWDEHE